MDTEKDEFLFFACKMLISYLYLFQLAARVCECMLLVYTTQFEREGRNCRLLGETGKSKFIYYISGLGIYYSG